MSSEAIAELEDTAAAGTSAPEDGKQEGIEIVHLAELPERAILDEARLAGILQVASRTVRRMVVRHELPPPISLAGRSVWLAGHVLTHIERAAVRAAEEAERAAAKLGGFEP
jgi:predicted DNA-binding transcriptional regulator AlpA